MTDSRPIFFILLLSLMAICVAPQVARSTSIDDRSLDALFTASELVASGRVDAEESKCSDDRCFYVAKISAIDVIKGVPVSSSISVCAFGPLGVRRKFTFFAIPSSSESTKGFECQFLALADGVITAEIGGMYFRHMSPEASGRIVFYDGSAFRTSEIEVPGWREKLAEWRALNEHN